MTVFWSLSDHIPATVVAPALFRSGSVFVCVAFVQISCLHSYHPMRKNAKCRPDDKICCLQDLSWKCNTGYLAIFTCEMKIMSHFCDYFHTWMYIFTRELHPFIVDWLFPHEDRNLPMRKQNKAHEITRKCKKSQENTWNRMTFASSHLKSTFPHIFTCNWTISIK